MTPIPYIVGGAAGVILAIIAFWVLAKCKNKSSADHPKPPKRIGTMNLILIITALSILVFVAKMIQIFEEYGTVPDTLITCFFAVCGGECGIMGWIKNTKERKRERRWELQDRRENEGGHKK